MEFQLLVSAGVPIPAAHLLSDHYNETRGQYYRELDYASRSKGDVIPFVMYATRGFVDGLRTQIERVRSHQVDVAWENFVHEVCGGKNKNKHKSATEKRQVILALDLSTRSGSVPYHDIMTLTPRLALAYAGKTRRTLTRDLNELRRLGLVARTKRGFRARKYQMRAFMPLRRGPLLQESSEPPLPDDSVTLTDPMGFDDSKSTRVGL